VMFFFSKHKRLIKIMKLYLGVRDLRTHCF